MTEAGRIWWRTTAGTSHASSVTPANRRWSGEGDHAAGAARTICCPARLRIDGPDGMWWIGEAECESVRVDRRHGARRDAHLRALAVALALGAGRERPDLDRNRSPQLCGSTEGAVQRN